MASRSSRPRDVGEGMEAADADADEALVVVVVVDVLFLLLLLFPEGRLHAAAAAIPAAPELAEATKSSSSRLASALEKSSPRLCCRSCF